MIKIKKISFDGFGIDYIGKDIDLNAIALINYRNFAEDNLSATVDIYSKISTVENDFSIKDKIPVANAELFVCGYNRETIIYCEKREKWIFKSTNSANEYVIDPNDIMYRCYNGFFIIEKGYDYTPENTIVFDYDLNILKNVDFDLLGESGEIYVDKGLNDYIINLREIYNYFYIDFDFSRNNYFYTNGLVSVCYDKRTKKNYLIKFDEQKNIVWQAEASENMMTYNILEYNNAYYCLYFTDKIGHKWKLLKYSDRGEIIDMYDFQGADAVITLHNDKPVIVYKDIAHFNTWQKYLVKTEKTYCGPAAMLIIE